MCDAGMDEQFLLRFGVQTLARSNECKKIGLVHTALLSAPQKRDCRHIFRYTMIALINTGMFAENAAPNVPFSRETLRQHV